MDSKPEYSIIIPVYNSEKTLAELIDRINKVFFHLNSSLEIILIDDGSHDNSWLLLKDLALKEKNLRLVRFSRNFGQNSAILCGFNLARGNYIITMDDDLQHPPEEIPKLIKRINETDENFRVVYGRYEPKHSSFLKNSLSRIFQKVLHRVLEIPDSVFLSPFAIYQNGVIKNVTKIKTSFVFIYGLVLKTTSIITIGDVEVFHEERKNGESNYNLVKYFNYLMDLIINYSSWPLHFISYSGIIISILSVSFGLWIVIHRLLDPAYGIIGWNSLMVAISFLGGAILLSMGVIGEYLRRILVETSYGQQYIIDEMNF